MLVSKSCNIRAAARRLTVEQTLDLTRFNNSLSQVHGKPVTYIYRADCGKILTLPSIRLADFDISVGSNKKGFGDLNSLYQNS